MAHRVSLLLLFLLNTASLFMLDGAAALELRSIKLDLPEGDRMFPDSPGCRRNQQ
ncbi:hypothetical protein [Bradyrhizobium sp. STM 3557]|uniref:hypothetical protein n=1 Tax=Bradyrhizobium sp. STM 3557 TaxID=578920 RepID=UPI00388EA261